MEEGCGGMVGAVDGMCKVVTHKTYNKIQNIETEIWYNWILLTDVYNDNMIVQNKVNNGAFKTNTLLSYYNDHDYWQERIRTGN